MTYIAWATAATLVIPALIFCAQCLASLLPRARGTFHGHRPRVAVLTPAHNESDEIGATLAELLPQLRPGDVALVVADNCDDDTATVARAAGAEVVVRHDPIRRGKGFALDAGVSVLSGRDYEVLVVLDADCRIEPGAVDALARQVAATGRPAQAVYLMDACVNPTARDRVSSWAFMVKNLVRPLGLTRFGLPCQLMGTGMAFPRTAIERVNLATASIVEDMQLGADLAMLGYAPRLCPDARVIGRLPRDGRTAMTQRRRWEHGHLNLILRQAPRLVWRGLSRLRFGAVAVGIDLLVPPLSLLVAALVTAAVITVALALVMDLHWGPALMVEAALVAVFVSVFLAWVKFGRTTLSGAGMLAAAGYVLWKLPMYALFLVRPEKKWVRTARPSDERPAPVADSAADVNEEAPQRRHEPVVAVGSADSHLR